MLHLIVHKNNFFFDKRKITIIHWYVELDINHAEVPIFK